MMKKYIFTESEKKQVKEAVESLEKESCGEIVPFFTRSSDDYNEVSWYLSLILTVSGIVCLALLSYTWLIPELSYIESAFALIALAIVGYLIPMIFPSIKRLLVPKERMFEMVSLRAREAFLNEKVFETEERVGILIFISRVEHLVLVLGDEGINKKLESKDWNSVVELIFGGLKRNKIGEGLVKAVDRCKELLLEHGFKRKASDTNELSNELRIKD